MHFSEHEQGFFGGDQRSQGSAFEKILNQIRVLGLETKTARKVFKKLLKRAQEAAETDRQRYLLEIFVRQRKSFEAHCKKAFPKKSEFTEEQRSIFLHQTFPQWKGSFIEEYISLYVPRGSSKEV